MLAVRQIDRLGVGLQAGGEEPAVRADDRDLDAGCRKVRRVFRPLRQIEGDGAGLDPLLEHLGGGGNAVHDPADLLLECRRIVHSLVAGMAEGDLALVLDHEAHQQGRCDDDQPADHGDAAAHPHGALVDRPVRLRNRSSTEFCQHRHTVATDRVSRRIRVFHPFEVASISIV